MIRFRNGYSRNTKSTSVKARITSHTSYFFTVNILYYEKAATPTLYTRSYYKIIHLQSEMTLLSSKILRNTDSYLHIQHHSNDIGNPEASATCTRRNHHSFLQGCYYSSSSSCWSSDSTLFLTPLHQEPTDVLLEANLRLGYHNGMKEHTRVAYDLPPGQQIGTTWSAIDRHTWHDHLGPFCSHKLASGLVLEEFGNSCTLELGKERYDIGILSIKHAFSMSSCKCIYFCT